MCYKLKYEGFNDDYFGKEEPKEEDIRKYFPLILQELEDLFDINKKIYLYQIYIHTIRNCETSDVIYYALMIRCVGTRI